jgi:spore maturation protein A
MNLAANMLGLGNAATPMGIKAMEELQTLNPSKDTATDPMVMLLAINTAGVQLLPSATLVAVMGLSSMAVFLPIIIVTGISLVIAIVTAKLLARLPGNRRSNPNLASPDTGVAA